MISFVVSRPAWLRGEGYNKSYLLRFRDQKMCCLGFLAKHCGIPETKLVNVKGPSILDHEEIEKFPAALATYHNHTDLCGDVMNVNDDCSLNDSRREQELQRLFAQAGIEVTFVD